MPSLSRNQFARQEPLEGWDQSLPTDSMVGYRPRPERPRPYDPGPEHKRGEIGVGQRILNVDDPTKTLEVSTGGLIPTTIFNDPTWSRRGWKYGGMWREDDADSQSVPDGELDEWTRQVTQAWERTPVETIGPDAQIRTNQITPTGMPNQPANVPHVSRDHVSGLRRSEVFADETSGAEKHPWIAEVEGKRYLLEGHHRAVASRTRGTGEMQAHVLRGNNWDDIEKQIRGA